jgi:hypothetical protein
LNSGISKTKWPEEHFKSSKFNEFSLAVQPSIKNSRSYRNFRMARNAIFAELLGAMHLQVKSAGKAALSGPE